MIINRLFVYAILNVTAIMMRLIFWGASFIPLVILYLFLGNLGFASNRKFISNVQSIPMLWDMKCKEYRTERLTKNFEWERIGEQFKLSGAQSLQKWIYFKEKYKRELAKPDSRWPLLNSLRFLDSNPRRARQKYLIKLNMRFC